MYGRTDFVRPYGNQKKADRQNTNRQTNTETLVSEGIEISIRFIVLELTDGRTSSVRTEPKKRQTNQTDRHRKTLENLGGKYI
jgi:hypothetical protein